MGVERHYKEGAITARGPGAMTQLGALLQSDELRNLKDPAALAAVHDAAATSDITQRLSRPGAATGPLAWPSRGNAVHTLCTSNGSPYVNFQNRIMYGTYQVVQKMPGGSNLVGFTRILHRTVEDELMEEVPTFHAVPLTPKCDGWCEFPVADRPNAVRQFFDAAQKEPGMIKAPWVLLIETDYVWMKPLQGVPLAESAALSWAFPYGYIVPTHKAIEGVMRSMFPEERGPMSAVPNSGPAPVLMRALDWLKVVPDWERLTAHIEATPEAKEKLGWVREMYAFSIACALQGVQLDLKLPPKSKLMVQPPADHRIGDAALLHYTWGSIFKDTLADNAEVWKFDKRFFTAPEVALKVPRLDEPPAWREGLTLQDGVKVSPDLVNILHDMVARMNEGSHGLAQLQPVPH